MRVRGPLRRPQQVLPHAVLAHLQHLARARHPHRVHRLLLAAGEQLRGQRPQPKGALEPPAARAPAQQEDVAGRALAHQRLLGEPILAHHQRLTGRHVAQQQRRVVARPQHAQPASGRLVALVERRRRRGTLLPLQRRWSSLLRWLSAGRFSLVAGGSGGVRLLRAGERRNHLGRRLAGGDAQRGGGRMVALVALAVVDVETRRHAHIHQEERMRLDGVLHDAHGTVGRLQVAAAAPQHLGFALQCGSHRLFALQAGLGTQRWLLVGQCVRHQRDGQRPRQCVLAERRPVKVLQILVGERTFHVLHACAGQRVRRQVAGCTGAHRRSLHLLCHAAVHVASIHRAPLQAGQRGRRQCCSGEQSSRSQATAEREST
mmetsp:Transcript_1810/g.5633  ORF Transcript_1810/g.5633 Transcript_1810/m.5633 type:complete len:374 (+) Transcript_1810:3548-4669(+)